MQIKSLAYDDELWLSIAEYAYNCSWRAGKNLAKEMKEHRFSDWERVFVVLEGDNIAGYCTLVQTDCIPNVTYTPYIGSIFIDEQYRGNRLSEDLILFVLDYAKGLGFEKVYLVSDHINLYEKYGFIKVDEKEAPWGTIETIFMHLI